MRDKSATASITFEDSYTFTIIVTPLFMKATLLNVILRLESPLVNSIIVLSTTARIKNTDIY